MALTVSSKVPFNELVCLLEKISTKQGIENKKKFLKKFIDEWRSFHDALHKDDPDTTDSFYPAMRLLLPQLEHEREAYGIKEITLARLYIELLGLGNESPAAQKLLNFRSPKNAKNDAGDFAAVVFWILKPRCPEKGSLTIEDVNTCLTAISVANVSKDKSSVRKNLFYMLRNMSAKEQKWLIRMILKDMKSGLSQASVFSVFHQDAEDVFNVKISLEKVCTLLKDSKTRLHEIDISIFTPFRPMLGERGNLHKIENLMLNKSFFIETKFDGERMQLHKNNDEYKFYSRGGFEYTSVYGDNSMSGNLTPYIHNCFKPSVVNCILDGEMVAYNSSTKCIASKGENIDMKSTNMGVYHPMFCVFDLLLLNNNVLSNKPLRTRKEILQNDLLEPLEGRVLISNVSEKMSNSDCIHALNEAIDERLEGIMVKNPDSIYKPNVRKGGWYKLKPDYIDGLMDELDVLVVGGYFGIGHRSGLMSHFLCAVALPEPGEDKPTKFYSFCKVGSGYNQTELYNFNKKLANHWQKFNKNKPPKFLELAPGLKQKPDAWIEPDKSIILQIRATEITDSEQFRTGFTLRFPRVEHIRDDKPWYDCMTLREVEDLRKISGGKLVSGHVGSLDDQEDVSPRKRKKTNNVNLRPTVEARFKGVDESKIKKVSEVFAGKEICVINGTKNFSKGYIENKIVELGGGIVQNPDKNTYCIIADKLSIKVRNLIKNGSYDVVAADWIIKCLESEKLIPWSPADMIHASSSTASEFLVNYDEHGDGYLVDTDTETLKTIFKNIKKESVTKLSNEDIYEVEMHYFPQDSRIFGNKNVYLDTLKEINNHESEKKSSDLTMLGYDLRYHGAKITKSIDSNTTHVIIDPSDLARVADIKKMNRERNRRFHLVSMEWATSCIKSKSCLKENLFYL